MNNVEFPEEQHDKGAVFDRPNKSLMVKWIINTGLVHNEKQANSILLVIAVIFILLSITIFFSRSNNELNIAKSNPIDKNSIPEEIRSQIPQSIMNDLPSKFYVEDIPGEILNKLSPDIVRNIPSKK